MRRLARHIRNVDQKLTAGALYCPAGMLSVAQEVLFAVGTGKFQFTHKN